jgi:hypothetical protein
MPALGSARWAAGSAALAAAALLAAGCGGGSAASPQPKPDPGGTSAPPSHSPGPDLHYPQQLDASRTTNDPCSALTDHQVHEVIGSLPGGGKTEHGAGVGCSWHPASLDNTSAGSIGIEWPSGGVYGMRGFYKTKNRYGYFQPTTVAGFPAVVASPGDTAVSVGECAVYVGVNEHRVFFSDFDSGATPPADLKPCGQARQAAKYVIHNLKGGS